jgi:TRAP-type C4-dicarboxylate transport system permease small subunit
LAHALTIVVDLLMLVVALFMAIYGGKLCFETWGQYIGEIPWMPVGATYLPVHLGGLITLVFVVEHMVFGSQSRRDVVTFDHEKLEVEAI